MADELKRALPLALLILFVLSPSLNLNPGASAAEDVNEKLKCVQEDIKKNEEKLERLRERETSVLSELEKMQKSLSKYESELRRTQAGLQYTGARIEETRANIALNQQVVERHRSWLKRKLRGIQRQGSVEELEMLFGADDMASFLRRWRYLEILAKREKASFDAYKELIKKLREQEEELNNLYVRYRKGEESARRAQEALAAKKAEKQGLLASVRSEKAVYRKLLEELKAASRELQAIIRRSDEDGYQGRGFRGLKGRLLWPVDGAVALQYGRQLDPQFRTPIFRNGIYIKTAPGAAARAIFDGKVVFADWFKGYGRLVIINHGQGYHTLYANLDEIFFKVGDIIQKRAEIGRVGESVLLNAPSLYFEVRYKGKPLDPLQWLGRK
jgi:septal ring factor EnvC (AmiA/AmiB activator)